MEKLKKPMIIACGGFVILFIFMFIMSSCKKKDYTTEEFSSYLLDKAKSYYSNHKDALPQTDTGKTSLNITTLVEDQEDYIGDTTCNGSIDVINNNGYYMYAPNINCSDGYSSTKLSTHLISSLDTVTSGNGLYANYDYYIFRGDNVDNYVIFNDQLWRILRINSDGSIKIIETDYIVKSKKGNLELKSSKRPSQVWDNRYNVDKGSTSGYNDFIHDGINSRIKDYLDDVYENEYSEETKGYIVKQNLCIGKRSIAETNNDGSVECSNILSDQYLGLIQLNEYINASLDPACISAESVTCSNYNYLATFKTTFWSLTAVSENSYDVFKIGKRMTDATSSSTATPKIVLNLSSEVSFTEGDGTEANPYIID